MPPNSHSIPPRVISYPILDRECISVPNLCEDRKWDSEFRVRIDRNAQSVNDIDVLKTASHNDAMDEDEILKTLVDTEYSNSCCIHQNSSDLMFPEIITNHISTSNCEYVAPKSGQDISVFNRLHSTEKLLGPMPDGDDKIDLRDSTHNSAFNNLFIHPHQPFPTPPSDYCVNNVIDDILTEDSDSVVSIGVMRVEPRYVEYSDEKRDVETAIERSKRDEKLSKKCEKLGESGKKVAVMNDILRRPTAFEFLNHDDRESNENLVHRHKFEKEQLKFMKERRKALEKENA